MFFSPRTINVAKMLSYNFKLLNGIKPKRNLKIYFKTSLQAATYA